MKVAILGDSMSIDLYPNRDAAQRFPKDGFETTGLGSGSLLERNADKMFPNFIGRDIRSRYPDSKVYNLSQDGGTIGCVQNQIDKIPDIDQKEMDYVFLTVGGNDLLIGLSMHSTNLGAYIAGLREHYKAMLTNILQTFPKAKVAIGTVYDPTDGSGYMPGAPERLPLEYLKQWNEFVRSFEGVDEIDIVDLYMEFFGEGMSVMAGGTNGKLNDKGLYWKDSIIEPNVYGASAIRELWMEVIEREQAVRETNGVAEHCISWDKVEQELGPERYKEFSQWMVGQTSTIHGVYKWDLDHFKSGGSSLD